MSTRTLDLSPAVVGAPSVEAQASDRLHALDAVRGFALLLGVVLHSAAAFLPDFPIPVWRLEANAAPALMYYVIHFFRMSAFFVIAGFFARMVVERRGVQAFAKDRAMRILLPLVVGLPIILVLTGIGVLLGALPHGMAYLTSLTAPPPGQGAAPAGGGIDLAHLWFLYYLVIFYVLALAIRAGVHALEARRSIAGVCDRVVSFLMRGPWGPVLLALPAALYFWHHQPWPEWLGLPAPSSLVPQAGGLVGYGVPFALGWLLHRQIPTLLNLRKSWGLYFVLAIALTVVCLSIVGTTPRWQGPNLHGQERVLYTAAYMVGTWCWVFAVIGGAVRFLSDPHPAVRYLADASYWIYLMHMMPIVFFITLLRPYHLHWALQLSIMLCGSMPLLLVSYHYLVRPTWIGAILNGRRRPRVAA